MSYIWNQFTNKLDYYSGDGDHFHDGDTLQLDGINSNGGAFPFTTSGPITLSQNLIIPNAGTIGSVTTPGAVAIDASGNVTAVGNILISKADPEHRLTDTGDSGYTRLTRTDTSAVAQRRNMAWKPGQTGALFFDAVGDYVNCGSDSSLGIVGALTISAWIKLNSDYTSTQTIISNYNGTSSYSLDFGRDDNEFAFIQGGTKVAVSSVALSNNNWHHIVIVRTGSAGNWDISWYFDGSFDETDNTAVNPSAATSYTAIGRLGTFNGFYFNGTIDEVAVWGKALSANDISDLYAAGAGLYIDPAENFPTDGGSQGDSLVGLWHLDDGTGNTAVDSSVEGNNGTLNPGSGQPAWTDGLVESTGSDTEILVWKSQDGTESIEGGIQTFGDSTGRTVLDGKSVRFNIGGIEKGQIDVNGNIVWANDLTISGGKVGVGLAPSYAFHVKTTSAPGGEHNLCIENTTASGYATLRMVGGSKIAVFTVDTPGFFYTGGSFLWRSSSNLPILFMMGNDKVMCLTPEKNLLFNTIVQPASLAGGLVLVNGTAPTTNVENGAAIYAYDIAAGHSAVHIRNENSTFIKLYQQAHITDANVAHGVASWADVDGALDALGTIINTLIARRENQGFEATA